MVFVISIYSYENNKLQARLVFPGKSSPLRGKDLLVDFSKLYLEIYEWKTMQINYF